MYKIGVIGDRDSILAFKAIGMDVFAAADYREASRLIARLAKEDYAVIFLTEELGAGLGEVLAEYASRVRPAMILIPNNQGSKGTGLAAIRASVEKAIGADIL